MTATTFWSNDPTILFNKDYITEIWPMQSMNFEQKLNAITRMVIILSLLGTLVTQKISFLVIGLITLMVVFVMYRFRKQKIVASMFGGAKSANNNNNGNSKEGFEGRVSKTTNPVTLETILRSDFYPVTKRNPMSNVLLTEIMDDPTRKAAAPSFNVDVYEDIMKATKGAVQKLNPGIKSTNKKLFGDLADQFDLDQSMRVFYTMPNTRVDNDQGAYGDFLYGDMPSAKESNAAGAVQRVKDNYRYLLY